MKGSGSTGERENSRRQNDGEEETKEVIWLASSAETNSMEKMKVTMQPGEASDSAR